MSTALHTTFMDIFSADFPLGEETVRVSKIVIPIIQRDYAQGRKDTEVKRVRDRFLESLKNAITNTPITLDFVYGDIDENGVMTPLDGQQRLTTLYLLHWYAAKREGIDGEAYSFLNNFSYKTRYSARDFCELLVNQYAPSFTATISEEIIDQAWFPLDWIKDPTISSMLVMLDSIHEVFGGIPNIWDRLQEKAISFYFLPVKEMGLTDELYIKMNSRGKPLTQFEHFKAELERTLREIDESIARRVIAKIDKDWTDMLWKNRGENNVIDDAFLRYFRFVCDILCYQAGGTTQGKTFDEFDLQKWYFAKDAENALANIEKLEAFFDCWCALGDQSSEAFMGQFVSYEHTPNKIKIETRYPLDIFGDCLRNHADVAGNGNRRFPLSRIILLFAVVTYLQNKTAISESEFSRRFRIINNLIQNSEDEISDSENRTSGNRMKAILLQVEKLVLTGKIDLSEKKALNTNQLEEEVAKEAWLAENPEKAESLFELEDHDLLQGQIAIIGLEHPEYFPRFSSLFENDWDLIDCALMSIGMYGQKEKKNYQLGTGSRKNVKAWRNLFHKSANSGFAGTKDILAQLLSKHETFDAEILSTIISEFLDASEAASEFDIRYYYVKYPHFRPGSHGKYTWSNYSEKPYECAVMQTAMYWSENTYQPFLKTIDDNRLSKNSCGQYLILTDSYIECTNDAYILKSLESEEEITRITIAQNDSGIDTENRIEKLRSLYPKIKENIRLIGPQ